jgi:hypothetical protein
MIGTTDAPTRPGNRRDLFSGIVCILAGLGIVEEALGYGIGSLSEPGPGLYPAALGAVLAVVGVMIAGVALAMVPQAEDPDPVMDGVPGAYSPDVRGPDWRGWSCIIGGVVLFILFATLAGLAPAIFACVFTAALGDRTASLKGSLILALLATVGGTVLFGYFLGINMQLWHWPVLK